VLPAHVDDDGRIHATASVEPGEAIDWPIPVAGFEPVEPEHAVARPVARPAIVPAEDAPESGA